MAGTASTTTITTGKCPKHAFAPRVFPSPPKPCSAHHISPRKRAFCPSHRLRHASDIPVAGDDPVNLSDPTGLAVNLQGVAKWAEDPTNLYGTDNGYGNDCTDFVSRALHFGGGDPESVPWWFRGALQAAGPIAGPGVARLAGMDDHYWYRFGYDIFLTAQSYSWSVADDLAEHLKLNGSHWLVNGMDLSQSGCPESGSYELPSSVVPGDVIFADWSSGSFSGISHVGVLVSVNGQLEIAQHTFDRIDTFADWQKGGSDTHVWVVDPNQG